MATAVILAGGMSRRMGRDKTALPFRGKTLLQGAVDRFSRVFDTVLVSVADPARHPELAGRLVTDEFPGCGPLAGLHAALGVCRDEGVFLTAADMPFSDPEAALEMIRLCRDHEVCALLGPRGMPEHLFAYYKTSLRARAEALLRAGEYRMRSLTERSDALFLPPEALGPLWRAELLRNVNSPEDYAALGD